MDKLMEYIKTYDYKLKGNDLVIRDHALENWDVLNQSQTLSKKAFVSKASISRYIKKMKFRSFKHFMLQKEYSQTHLQEGQIDYNWLFNYIEKEKINLLKQTNSINETERIIKVGRELSTSEFIYITGAGYSKIQGETIQKRLSRLGKEVQFIGSPQVMPFVRKNISLQNSLLLCISQTGETKEAIEICKIFANQNCPIVAITSDLDSTLAHLANDTLQVPKVCSGLLLETIYSEVTVNYLLDCIYSVELMDNYEQNIENYVSSFKI